MGKVKIKKDRSKLRIFIISLILIIFAVFFAFLFFISLLKPSNNRNWADGFTVLPHITIEGSMVTIKNVRDFRYSSSEITSHAYLNRSVNVDAIEKVWFVVAPFIVKPFTHFNGVAHTYFIFDFTDQEPIVVSVEARREVGETYNTFQGLFNQYEVMYVWGQEEDLTGKRAVLDKSKLYMYPLIISKNSAKRLLLQLAETTIQLENNPRFYNLITSNCTNELAKNVNKVKKNVIPFNRALLFPGFSGNELYKLGFLPKNMSFETLSKKYYITDIVKDIYSEKNFSNTLRERIK